MARTLPKFECLFCRECCYFSEEYEMPTVLPWERRLLEELAQQHGVTVEFKPLQVYVDADGRCVVTLYRWIIRGYCPFLDRASARCRIHSSKPLSCRMYPLVLEVPTGRLMLSSKCEWVARMGRELAEKLSNDPTLIQRVFPREFDAAIEAFTEPSAIYEYVTSKGMKPLNPNGLEGCREVLDVDEYIARFG